VNPEKRPVRQIIALGGGGFSMEPENLSLDRYFLEQTGKDRPKVCFLATASGDSEDYLRRFYAAYGRLECEASHLGSVRKLPANWERFLLSQDAVFVGGGSTRDMLVIWREWQLDSLLWQAYQKGVILGGTSAGAICWFEEGLSDSMVSGQLRALRCLGFLRGSFCPHYDGEIERRPCYHELIGAGTLQAGIAADDGVAIHYIDERLMRVVSSRAKARAYFVSRAEDANGGQTQELELPTFFFRSG
jgi:dipeptidase E